MDDLLCQMVHVSRHLTQKNIEEIGLLFKDKIGEGVLEEANNGIRLLKVLMERKFITCLLYTSPSPRDS